MSLNLSTFGWGGSQDALIDPTQADRYCIL